MKPLDITSQPSASKYPFTSISIYDALFLYLWEKKKNNNKIIIASKAGKREV